jgi:hypothetical protein
MYPSCGDARQAPTAFTVVLAGSQLGGYGFCASLPMLLDASAFFTR